MRGERPRSRGEVAAAAVLMRSGPAAGIAVLGVSVLAVVLVPAGWWRPVVVLPLLVPVVAGTVWLTRAVPSSPRRPVPPWTALTSVMIAVGFALWSGLTRGEHLIIRRDAGSYALFAHWLAAHHRLPVDADLAAFGGPAALGIDGFSLASPAFFQVLTGSGGPGPGGATGAHLVPQFLLGAPALYSLGCWPAGWTGLFAVPALVGGLAVLAAAGLAARLISPAWAPVAAGVLALTQPVLHAARSTLSEPPALLLVLAAAAVAVDAVERGNAERGNAERGNAERGNAERGNAERGNAERGSVRRLAVLAGALLGLAGLVRVDVLREVAIVVPVGVVLALRRHRAGVPLVASALVGAGLSMIPAWWFSRPYLDLIGDSLRPLALGTVALAGLGAVVLVLARGHVARQPVEPRAVCWATGGSRDRWLPVAAGVAVVAFGVGLATRPLWMVVRQSGDDPAVPLIASLQRQQHLPVDGARTYAEQSVNWLVWYVGPVTAAVALVVAAVLVARAVRWWLAGGSGQAPAWLVPFGVGLGSVLLTLYRPGITPDHPWADRRLVPVVLPATVLLAVAGAAWAVRAVAARTGAARTGAARTLAARTGAARTLAARTGAARTGAARTVAPRAAAAAAVLALAVPAGLATWPLADRRTEVGQPRAAADVCAALRPGDTVVAVEDAVGGIRAQNEWVQVVRGVCGHPSAALVTPVVARPAAVARLGRLVTGAGGRLVLLAAGEDDAATSGSLAALGLTPRRATLLRTAEDQHLLTRRSRVVDSLVIDVWLAVWEPTAGR